MMTCIIMINGSMEVDGICNSNLLLQDEDDADTRVVDDGVMLKKWSIDMMMACTWARVVS